jgi:hypothetical protein
MANNSQNQTPEQLENTKLWESWRHVGPGMLKQISGGNLNGMTDINPLWRFRALTEAFGPIGIGWNVKEVERWTNEAAGEVGAFVKVQLRIKFVDEVGNEAWSEPIEGIGGSKLCGKGHGAGLNDEAWKMATTDAISVACKALGMAADVYTGKQSHSDEDQQGSKGDYGSKYERRNYTENEQQGTRRWSYTGRGGYAQNSGASAPAGQVYQTPPPGGENYVQPQGQRQHTARVCEVVDIQKGKAERLIKTLSTYDYEDAEVWSQGLAWLRNEVVLGEGAEALIVQKAVEMRQAYEQHQVNSVRS